MNWWLQLDKTRGSRPRSVWMMEGSRETVADRLTRLVGRPDVVVSPNDHWMPRGTPALGLGGTWDATPADEAKLGDTNDLLLPEEQQQLKTWWLEHNGKANTPNWDIASTCRVGAKKALLLVEAKAHQQEIQGEAKGKPLAPTASDNSFENHLKIGHAVADAAAHLQRATKLPWGISRDTCYQMSNRFAWSWKVTTLGYPVVLVYLGFLNAEDMRTNPKGPDNILFPDRDSWKKAVLSHGRGVVPAGIWGLRWLMLNGQEFIPLIRSVEIDYDRPVQEFAVT